MRPLPRLHAVTDTAVLGLADFPARAAAIAAAGSPAALHARDRSAGGARLTAITRQLLALARPQEASVFVNARPDVAVALGAHGVQLGRDDLTPREVREAFPAWHGWIGVSVHSAAEAARARSDGADFLMAGPVYPTATHPGLPGQGPELVRRVADEGLPVVAIGGMTPDRCTEVRRAGAWGVAAISGLWHTPDPGAAALLFLAAMTEGA